MRRIGLVVVLLSLAALLLTPHVARADVEMPAGFRIDCERMYSGEGVGAPPPRFGIDRGQHFLYWAAASVDNVTFCDAFFNPNNAVLTCDANSNGMIDSWEVAIVGAVLCNPSHPLYADVEAAFQAHITALEGESDPLWGGGGLYAEHVHDYLAAHMLCSTAARDFWVTKLPITGTYAPFTTSPDEPLSPGDDLDGDEVSNQQEYENVRNRGGSRSQFYEAVADPENDGTIDIVPVGGIVALAVLVGACIINDGIFATGRYPANNPIPDRQAPALHNPAVGPPALAAYQFVGLPIN